MELICQCINTERESKGGITGQPLGTSPVRTATLHLCGYVCSRRGGGQGTCKGSAWKDEEKAQSNAHSWPTLQHHLCALGLLLLVLLTEIVTSSCMCCIHLLFPTRCLWSLKEGCFFSLLRGCSVSSCYAAVLTTPYKSNCSMSKSSCCCNIKAPALNLGSKS